MPHLHDGGERELAAGVLEVAADCHDPGTQLLGPRLSDVGIELSSVGLIRQIFSVVAGGFDAPAVGG